MSRSISTIIPVYNGQDYVAEAIDSILQQTHPVDEIVVVDDGSTDRSAEIVDGYHEKVRLVRIAHGGISAAVNAGIEAATGDLLTFLDADDVWLPKKIELQLRHLDSNPETEMIFCHQDEFVSPELDDSQKANLVAREESMPVRAKSTMMCTRSLMDSAGHWKLHVTTGDFIEWYSRATATGAMEFVLPDLLVRRRVHLDNYTRHHKDERTHYVNLMKQHLDRIRMKNA